MKNLKKIFFIKSSFIIIRNKFIRANSLKNSVQNSRILFIPSLSIYYIYIYNLKKLNQEYHFQRMNVVDSRSVHDIYGLVNVARERLSRTASNDSYHRANSALIVLLACKMTK